VPSNGSSASSVILRDGTSVAANQITDVHGNTIILNTGAYTDSMGLSALTATSPNFGPFTWTDANGHPRSHCRHIKSNIADGLRMQWNWRDKQFSSTAGKQIDVSRCTYSGVSYETTPSHSPDITGRIGSLTLREGGTVTYSYLGTNKGINCTYQSAPELKRVDNDGTTTYTLAYSPISGANYKATNTVVDNGGNNTVYTFTGFTANGISPTYGQALTKIQRY
jgi:hypothetical protein